ncbi:response regulator transcription factor [Paenibacillus flagellatus]|uniref:DNA-binding response regulator n=1 Tax=Paenibacillus flagellatus TaxID=2211139 RepID=A0A2V5K9Q5_9BACL|nr:response regulator transcription factor [Paenibacillus flagellatus]PYI56118.1 DNA-binding response regulator [Paenibacillus flagellatus]
MNKILVIDDEADLRGMLRDYLEMNGYFVLTAKDGQEGLKQAEKQPDLILLDIGMPGMNGLELCRSIRSFVSCPILFLTARVEDADKIAGFQAGGDDYMVKPFSIHELGARVEAHLRREMRSQNKAAVKFADDLVIDYAERTVYGKGVPLPLTKKEFDIVELLSTHSGMVFDKERIYERVWGTEEDGDSAVIAEHIRRIRNKMNGHGCGDRIETVWGVGYKWRKS